MTEPDLANLRTEIADARAMVDLELDQRWPGIPPLAAERNGFDASIQKYARWESDHRIVVRRQLLQANEQSSGISRRDDWLSLAHSGVSIGRWKLAGSPDFVTLPGKSGRGTPYQLSFSHDGRLLACGSYSRGVEI